MSIPSVRSHEPPTARPEESIARRRVCSVHARNYRRDASDRVPLAVRCTPHTDSTRTHVHSLHSRVCTSLWRRCRPVSELCVARRHSLSGQSTPTRREHAGLPLLHRATRATAPATALGRDATRSRGARRLVHAVPTGVARASRPYLGNCAAPGDRTRRRRPRLARLSSFVENRTRQLTGEHGHVIRVYRDWANEHDHSRRTTPELARRRRSVGMRGDRCGRGHRVTFGHENGY